jgi:lycopene cyclase domain-containing protein
MIHFTYLMCLVVVILCLLIIDSRYKLAFWYDAKRTTIVLSFSFVLFLIWDCLGIGFGIFLQGTSKYQLPLSLIPQLPIEELFFLFLLCYITLILYRGVGKVWPHI